MGLSRKDYVVQVTTDVQEDIKSVLQGHAMKPAFLTLLASRPDAIAKLAMFAWSSKAVKKGKNALKRSKNFKICAYKNFTEFNFNARKDVELFMDKLSPADAETFKNDENIVTILVLQDKDSSGDIEKDIVNGTSVLVPFDRSILKEYKINGGIYFTVMFGDSYVMPRVETIAAAKENQNKRIVERTKSASKLIKTLMEKAKAKLASLAGDLLGLKFTAAKTSAELEQVASLGNTVGATSNDPRQIVNAIKSYNRTNSAIIEELASTDRNMYNKAILLLRKGKKIAGNRILREIGLPEVMDMVATGLPASTDQISAERAKAYRAQIKTLTDKNTNLLGKLTDSNTPREKAQARFDIKQNVDKINILKARIGSLKNIKIGVLRDKSKLLAQTNKSISDNLAKGATIQGALQMALAKLPISNEEKQQIRQQIVSQVANQTPMQYAVQQAIQNVVVTNADTSEFEQVVDDVDVDSLGADDNFDGYSNPEYNQNFDVTDDEIDMVGSGYTGEDMEDEEFDSLASSLSGTKSIQDILASI